MSVGLAPISVWCQIRLHPEAGTEGISMLAYRPVKRGAQFEDLDEGVLMAPLDSRYTVKLDSILTLFKLWQVSLREEKEEAIYAASPINEKFLLVFFLVPLTLPGFPGLYFWINVTFKNDWCHHERERVVEGGGELYFVSRIVYVTARVGPFFHMLKNLIFQKG